jgi:hypothetical protein
MSPPCEMATTVCSGCRSAISRPTAAPPIAELSSALAPRGHRREPVPGAVRGRVPEEAVEIAPGSTFELSEGHLPKPRVEPHRKAQLIPDDLGRSPSPREVARVDVVDPALAERERRGVGLLSAEIRELTVRVPLNPTRSIELGLAVANEDEPRHGAIRENARSRRAFMPSQSAIDATPTLARNQWLPSGTPKARNGTSATPACSRK